MTRVSKFKPIVNILCACGCKTEIPNRDSRNRPRTYVGGHGRIGKKNYWASKPDNEVNYWYTHRKARIIYGNKKECSISMIGMCRGGLDIHHIDADAWNNKMENLVCLCRRHHILVENGLIDLKNPKSPEGYVFPNGRTIYKTNKQYEGVKNGKGKI